MVAVRESMGNPSPHNLEIEQAVLGGIMVGGATWVPVAGILQPEHFHEPLHGRIYAAIIKMASEGCEPSLLLLKPRMESAPALQEIGGAEYLITIYGMAPPPVMLESHAKLIRELAERRVAIESCTAAVDAFSDIGSTDFRSHVSRHLETITGEGMGQASRLEGLSHAGTLDHTRPSQRPRTRSARRMNLTPHTAPKMPRTLRYRHKVATQIADMPLRSPQESTGAFLAMTSPSGPEIQIASQRLAVESCRGILRMEDRWPAVMQERGGVTALATSSRRRSWTWSATEKHRSATVGILRDEENPPDLRLTAARIIAPYVHPRPAPDAPTVRFDLPQDLSTAHAVKEAHMALLRATSNGEVPVALAKDISTLFETQRRVIETVCLEERITKLEQRGAT